MEKWRKYPKKYSISWEKDSQIKNWLQPSDKTYVLHGKPEAFCKLCRVHIRAHKNDLLSCCAS